MKIVSITPDIDSGGAAKSLYLLSRQIVADGHELHIISIAKPSRTKRKVEELREMGVGVDYYNIPYFPLKLHVCPIPFWKNVRRSVENRAEYKRLADRVREINPDIIHYNSYTTLLISLWLRKYPAILHAREVLIEPAKSIFLARMLMQKSISEVIGITPAEGQQAERLFSLPTTVVNNWPEAPLIHTPMPPDTPLVYGVFSHITPIKGHLECVKACALAADGLRKASVTVRLFGGRVPIHEEYYQQVLDEVERSNLHDIVDFRGFTDHPEEEMRKTHLVVRPDVTGQPWGRDVIEAMCLGRPVLAFGKDDFFVKRDLTGRLESPGDVQALADAMVDLADYEKLTRLGASAFAFAQSHFDPVGNPRRIIERMDHIVSHA
nr:glycosyltransferase family 4 protein [uncultured Pseudodesulfovibrio sp.]